MNNSKKIEIISLMAMTCVVWWHCYCGSQIERWFIPGFCVWSVPWFFFISGVLFRRTLDSKSNKVIILQKAHSLLVPYIIWCIIGAIITFFIRGWGGGLGCFGLNALKIHPWGNSALWYVRVLMIFMGIVVLSDFINKRLLGNNRFVLFVLSIIFIGFTSRFLVCLGPSSSGFYFVLGMMLSGLVLTKTVSRKTSCLIGLSSMVVGIIMRLFWFRCGFNFVIAGGTFVANCSVIFLLTGLWFLFDIFPVKIVKSAFIAKFSCLTAFVYFMHYPINDYIKHIFGWVKPDVMFILLCLLGPLTYLIMALVVKRYFNKAYVLLSGGR